MNDVTDILRDRMHAPPGLERMAVVSALVHTAVVATLILAPDSWFPAPRSTERVVMTISLGGTAGPENGGITNIGGRAIQMEPLETPDPRYQAIRAPARQTPEMILPDPSARPQPQSAEVEQAPEDARGRTPSRGAEPQEGSAVAETGARGRGFGLSTGGGGVGGTGVQLDVADFCCPSYIEQMIEKIRAHWDARAEVPGVVTMKFTIQRSGLITDAQIERPARFQDLNFRAQRALVSARELPPLPAGFPNETLTVHLNFEYTR